MAKLVISREKALWQDRARQYAVVVDGEEVGKIGNGGELSVDLAPGSHTVQMRIDWCSSPALEVSLQAGNTVYLACGPAANPLLGGLYVTVWKDRYLWLRQVAGPSR